MKEEPSINVIAFDNVANLNNKIMLPIKLFFTNKND